MIIRFQETAFRQQKRLSFVKGKTSPGGLAKVNLFDANGLSKDIHLNLLCADPVF